MNVARIDKLEKYTKEKIPENQEFFYDVCSLMKINGVDIGKKSHYETKEEITERRQKIHRNVITQNRLFYALMFCYPGVLNKGIEEALYNLLSNKVPEKIIDFENIIIPMLFNQLKITQKLRLFMRFSENGKHTQRIVRLGLKCFLNPPYEYMWFIKYREKLRKVLGNLWGKEVTKTIRYLVSSLDFQEDVSSQLNKRNKDFLYTYILKYCIEKDYNILQAINFLWDRKKSYTLQAFVEYKHLNSSLEKIEYMSPEIIFGKRSTYHPNTPKAQVYELVDGEYEITARVYKKALNKRFPNDVLQFLTANKTVCFKTSKAFLDRLQIVFNKETVDKYASYLLKWAKVSGTMTKKQRVRVSSAARRSGTSIQTDKNVLSLKELYLLALSDEMTQEMECLIRQKAKEVSKNLPFNYDGYIGVVLDESFSMSGSREQKNHPYATALACRDILYEASKEKLYVSTTSGSPSFKTPQGGTDLSFPLIKILQKKPDVIFIISDGYENTPSGRVDELLALLRDKGFNIPIYHINPVVSSKEEVRSFVGIPVIPIAIPENLGAACTTVMLQTNPSFGLQYIINASIKQLKKLTKGN